MTSLTSLTIAQAREMLAKKEISAKELTQAHLTQMDATKELNLFVTETADIALSQAEASDKRIADGTAGIMEGVPVGVKDLFCTKGVRTTAGSRILENYVPEYESTVSQNLMDAGAVMLGKLNMDEFAMGSANLTSYYGPTHSPIKAKGDDRPLVPGGSSGASAAGVAAHTMMGALGSDTGGSIRQPAAFCGVVGIKPTYGLCSRFGMVAFSSSLDQAGPLTRTVEDSAIMLQSIVGYDAKDATSIKYDAPNYTDALTKDIKGLRVGIPKEYRIDGMAKHISDMWEKGIEWMKQAGAEIVDVSLPHTKYALPTYYIIAPAEASSNLARYDGVRYGMREEGDDLIDMYECTRAKGFGEEVKTRLMIGTYVLSAGYYDAYFMKAQRVRKLVKQDFEEVFKDVDVLLTPSTPNGAFPVDQPPTDPVEMYMNDVLTVPVNLAGLPGISVPAGLTDDGRPLGLQVIGNAFQESTVLRVADVIEDAADFSNMMNKAG
ncbi:MAG: Asp-tRNA(Asn)/Glu-tRNA(Gln) amidotransferase subunit GatA [Alphaproteobacteria bacterium]